MMPVPTTQIDPNEKTPCDLFINLPLNQRFIKYRSAGQALEEAAWARFEQYKVPYLYIRQDSQKSFNEFVALKFQKLLGERNSESAKKALSMRSSELLRSALSAQDPAVGRALLSGFKDITLIIIDSVLESSGRNHMRIFNRLKDLAETGTDFQKHPVQVASLALMISIGIGYTFERTLTDLAMASLLHDVGLSEMPMEIVANAHHPDRLTFEQQQLLFAHPGRSIEILNQRGVTISEVSKTIILQHHELYNGKGYPLGLRNHELNELSQLLWVADNLENFVNDYEGSLKSGLLQLFSSWEQAKKIEPKLLSRIRLSIF